MAKIDTFVDKFGNLNNWNTSTGGSASVSIVSGQMVAGWSGNTNSGFYITSKTRYDISSPAKTYFKVDRNDLDTVYLALNSSNNLYINFSILLPQSTSTYYIRIKSVDAGDNYSNIVFEMRSKTGSWTVLDDTNTFPNATLTSMSLSFNASRNSTDGSFIIDDLGVLPAPKTDFTATPLKGRPPLTVQFTDTSTNAPTSWLWDFGDGATSTEQSPQHIYPNVGTYSPKLTATNIDGSVTETKADYISVAIVTVNTKISGKEVYNGKVRRGLKAYRKATGKELYKGTVAALVIKNAEGLQTKTYLYKVYDPSGNYITTLQKLVISEPNFTREINSIGSSMKIELAINSDSLSTSSQPLLTEDDKTITTEADSPLLVESKTRNAIGTGTPIDYNNRIDIYVYYGSVEPLLTEDGLPILTEYGEPLLADVGAPNGKRIFSGYISEINSRYGSTETTVLQLTSFGADLKQYVLKDGSGNTTVTYNSSDPSAIARSALDYFVATSNAEQKTYTKYTNISIPDTGYTVSYTFKSTTIADLLDKTLELMPSDWYYRVGLDDNTVYFDKRSTTPAHLFYLGKHIQALDLKGSILGAVNDVLFTGGTVDTTNNTSLYLENKKPIGDRVRRGLSNISDNRVTQASSAQIITDSTIGDTNKVLYRTTIEIVADTYDIERIKVGEVVGFRNFGNFVDALTMQIVGISYDPDVVQLQLASKPVTVNKRLEDIKRNLTIAENRNQPNKPS